MAKSSHFWILAPSSLLFPPKKKKRKKNGKKRSFLDFGTHAFCPLYTPQNGATTAHKQNKTQMYDLPSVLSMTSTQDCYKQSEF